MGLGNMPLLTALKTKMQWHQTRQGLLAENVANGETPGYRGRDLKAFDFATHLQNTSVAHVSVATTNPGHISGMPSETGSFSAKSMRNFEVTPEGNGVTLEDEMMKVSQNQMDYQAATTLYTRSIRLMRTALGR